MLQVGKDGAMPAKNIFNIRGIGLGRQYGYGQPVTRIIGRIRL